MAEFAAKLRSRDSNRLNHPIADLTELKGAFDFTLQYATVGTINDVTTKGLPRLAVDPRRRSKSWACISNFGKRRTPCCWSTP